MKLSQEDIADIASADIPAEDVVMLEDGSGGDDKGANEKSATAAPHKRRLQLNRPAPALAASGERSTFLAILDGCDTQCLMVKCPAGH